MHICVDIFFIFYIYYDDRAIITIGVCSFRNYRKQRSPKILYRKSWQGYLATEIAHVFQQTGSTALQELRPNGRETELRNRGNRGFWSGIVLQIATDGSMVDEIIEALVRSRHNRVGFPLSFAKGSRYHSVRRKFDCRTKEKSVERKEYRRANERRPVRVCINTK